MEKLAQVKLAQMCANSPVQPNLGRFLQKLAAMKTAKDDQPGIFSRIGTGLANLGSGMAAGIAGGLGAGALGLGALALRTGPGRRFMPLLRSMLPGSATRELGNTFRPIEQFAARSGQTAASMTPAQIDRLMRDFVAAGGRASAYSPERLAQVAEILKNPAVDTTSRLGRFFAGSNYRRLQRTAQNRSLFGGVVEQRGVWDNIRNQARDAYQAVTPAELRPYVPLAAGAAALTYGPSYIWGPQGGRPARQPMQVQLQ